MPSPPGPPGLPTRLPWRVAPTAAAAVRGAGCSRGEWATARPAGSEPPTGSTRTALVLYSGRADERVADVVREPVHLRLGEVEGHPDEAGVDAVAELRARLELAAARDEPHPVAVGDAERDASSGCISTKGSSCFCVTPPRASSSSPSCSGRACARSRGRTGTRSRAARSAAGTRPGRTCPCRSAATGFGACRYGEPGWSRSVHGHWRPTSSMRS